MTKKTSEKIINLKDAVEKKIALKKAESQEITPDKKVYQLKISLNGFKPSIFRTLQVPEDITLETLHNIIQVVMPWEDYHMHLFTVGNRQERKVYGNRDSDPDFDEKKYKLKNLGLGEKQKFIYEYDMGDGWEHEIKIEKILPYDPTKKYPVCIKGAMKCPPEDCGGIWGYAELLEIITDPEHEDYEERMDWLGEETWNPEEFDINAINKVLTKLKIK